MELMVCFGAFRIFAASFLIMELFNMNRNQSGKKKARVCSYVLFSAFPLITADAVRFLLRSTGGTSAQVIAASGVYYVFLVVTLFFVFVYSRNFMTPSGMPGRGPVLKKLAKGLSYSPGILMVVFSAVDLTGTITLAIAMLFMLWISHESQNDLISVDALTRLNNRNALNDYLAVKLSSSSRDRICLIMLDMNRFKSINDTYGHVEGDRALSRTARCIKKACSMGITKVRPFIARFGGDEFVIVLDTRNDREVDRICDAIYSQLDFENENSGAPYELSISAGWARNLPNNRSAKELLGSADKCLYKKKNKLRLKEKSA
ncbi:MAG: GGDEF domain-containing protein [Eubacterium sp.]|nr:GGDEF domain-containing protein [Eubacterium sp.]